MINTLLLATALTITGANANTCLDQTVKDNTVHWSSDSHYEFAVFVTENDVYSCEGTIDHPWSSYKTLENSLGKDVFLDLKDLPVCKKAQIDWRVDGIVSSIVVPAFNPLCDTPPNTALGAGGGYFPTTVPEPSTYLLLITGLFLLGIRNYVRKSRTYENE